MAIALLQGWKDIGLCLQDELPEDVPRHGARRRSLEGGCKAHPPGLPHCSEACRQVAGAARAGLTFEKVLVPCGCRVPPTEPPLAPGSTWGFLAGHPGWSCYSESPCSGCSMKLVPGNRELPQRLASPNGCSLEMSREPVQGAACLGTARAFSRHLPRATPGFP